MTERPILFSAPMITAILSGDKTQTRRVLKDQDTWNGVGEGILRRHPRQTAGTPVLTGDRLWVREAWQTHCDMDHVQPRDLPASAAVQYPATYDHWASRRRASIHMPRWASRITLSVTDVRVQRLQDISEEDAKAEGAPRLSRMLPNLQIVGVPYRDSFQGLWEEINGRGAWEANPWVYAITFSVEQNRSERIEPACPSEKEPV